MNENIRYVLKCMSDAGMSTLNIGPQDLQQGKAYLVFSLLFQNYKRHADKCIVDQFAANQA